MMNKLLKGGLAAMMVMLGGNAMAMGIPREAQKNIEEVCSGYTDGKIQIYCQDAQVFAHRDLGLLVGFYENKASRETEFGIVNDCVEVSGDDEGVVDYALAVRCIYYNLDKQGFSVSRDFELIQRQQQVQTLK